jgi:hypothetical protein
MTDHREQPPHLEHRGFDWPPGGVNPFDRGFPEAGRLYWAHERPSLLFPANQQPEPSELDRAIPKGYTTLLLMERVAVVTLGERSRREWKHQALHRSVGPFQEYQLIVPPDGPEEKYLMVGAIWPFQWTHRDAVRLGQLTGRVVLVCRVLSYENWH